MQKNLSDIDTFHRVFNDNWKLKILLHLSKKEKRFKDLKKEINTSEKTLCIKLKELEKDSLINRESFNEMPPRVNYSLNKTGKSLIPIINNLLKWTKEYQSKYKKD